MNVRPATSVEISDWNMHLSQNPDGGNIVQTSELAALKEQNGWTLRYLFVGDTAVLIQERSIPGLGKLWYAPKGPGSATMQQATRAITALKNYAARHGVFLLQVEPEVPNTPAHRSQMKKLGGILTQSVQPNISTVLIDLEPTTEEIMTKLPQKARHAIRRAFRDGLTVRQVKLTDSNMETMIKLMHTAVDAKHVMLRDSDYYKRFWTSFAKSGAGALFFAYDGKKPVAGAYVLVNGKKATYKDGGSVREKTIYGASHALQWHVIEWLKKRGVTSYDLCGAPPADRIHDRSHPLAGVGTFKLGFNKTITEYVGSFDIPLRTRSYKIWKKFARGFYIRWYTKVLKRYFY